MALERGEPSGSVVNGESAGFAGSKGLSRRVVKEVEEGKSLGQFTNLITVRSLKRQSRYFMYTREIRKFTEKIILQEKS